MRHHVSYRKRRQMRVSRCCPIDPQNRRVKRFVTDRIVTRRSDGFVQRSMTRRLAEPRHFESKMSMFPMFFGRNRPSTNGVKLVSHTSSLSGFLIR